MWSALSSSNVGEFDFLLEYYSMSKRYIITVKYKHPRKVNQFAFSPDGENDLSVSVDENNIKSPLQTKEIKPQLEELDKETTFRFLDSIKNQFISFTNGEPLTYTKLRQFFNSGNYPLIKGLFMKLQSAGINFENKLYAWPGDLGGKAYRTWTSNIQQWSNEWLNKTNLIEQYEETPFLHDIDDPILFKAIIDQEIKKMIDEGIETNLPGFDDYIQHILPRAKFKTTGRSLSGEQRNTPALPFISFGGLRFRVNGYREWTNEKNLGILRNELHTFSEKQKGAAPILRKNIGNIEQSFSNFKFYLEKKLKDFGFTEWLQQNFKTYQNGRINTSEVLNFLIGNNPQKNVFKLSTTHFDEFVVNENSISVTSPYSLNTKELYYNESFIVPELGRIDLYVETPNGPIAYECDGFFHYGNTRLTNGKNFIKPFLNDQIQKYYLEKVLNVKLIRRPLLSNWKKDIMSFIKDDLSAINSPLEKAAYNNYLFFK